MEIEKLVRAAKEGNDEAFYELLVMHKEQLYKMAYLYLKDQQNALEAVQEVTYRAYTKIHRLKEAKYFQTWIIRIMIHYCIDEQKKQKRSIPVEEIFSGSMEEDPVERIYIQTAVDALDPRYRQVVVLKYFEDLTIGDIAKVMQKPEGTVKTWLHHALKQLRDALKEERYHG